MRYSFYHVVLVKFYCDVTKEAIYSLSTLQSTPFFSKLHAFLRNKEEEGRPMMVKRKLGGTVDESSAD